MSKHRGPVSATELMERLERDPEYQARQREKDRVRLAAVAANKEAAAPIVSELVAAGFPIRSIADLYDEKLKYPAAIPILLAWLPKVENDAAKQEIVRCLSVPYAKPHASRALIAEFRRAEGDSTGLRWTIGDALEVLGDDSVADDMIELAADRRYGKAREMLVVGLAKLCDPRVVPVLLDLLGDPDVSGHAVVALRKLAPPSARGAVEPFLKDPRAWVRKEAKRALEKIEKALGGVH